jgi:luciferase family oxidoreductase group 1
MTSFSFLDLVPILEGGTISAALANAADIAAHCEACGYDRYWVAEHHGMVGIGGAATSVVLAHVGRATRTIRIGAGGIMLPNHAPLQIAEQFGTLDALFPGRIDLGLGRAPGGDMAIARALRRTLQSDPNAFPQDVVELMAYFDGDARTGVTAVPGAGAAPQIWILGSSTFGAQLAAMLGLPYGFASHFAPAMLDEALEIYRRNFRPSAVLDRPHVMAAYNVIAADDEDEARYLATSSQQAFVALRTGTPGKMKPPVRHFEDTLGPQDRAMLANVLAVSSIGTVAMIQADLKRFLARTRADEIILSSQIYDHAARKHSISLAAQGMAGVRAAVQS